MFGKRCQLCGGKLDHNICTLCGLDNSKTDSNYKLNQSSCDRQPLTHVHTEGTPVREHTARPNTARPNVTAARPVSANRDSGKKAQNAGTIIKIIFVIVIVVQILSVAFQMIDFNSGVLGDTFHQLTGGDHYEEDWYANVTRALSDEGEEYKAVLNPGTYIVGVHIPEGTYTVESPDEEAYVSLSLNDEENRIYFWENFDTQEGVTTLDDVRCYVGARVTVGRGGNLFFHSSNAQTDTMTALDNPLTEGVTVKNGDVAGVDFPAGTYDIIMQEGNIDFGYTVPGTVLDYPEEDDYVEMTERMWIDTYEGEFIYRNLYLPEGTDIFIEEGEVNLVPSEKIPKSYEGYYYIYE